MKRIALFRNNAQTALEYMLLLMTVVVIVMVGFKVFLPRVTGASGVYLNRTAYGIQGKPPHCGDHTCNAAIMENQETCCVDCPTPGLADIQCAH